MANARRMLLRVTPAGPQDSPIAQRAPLGPEAAFVPGRFCLHTAAPRASDLQGILRPCDEAWYAPRPIEGTGILLLPARLGRSGAPVTCFLVYSGTRGLVWIGASLSSSAWREPAW